MTLFSGDLLKRNRMHAGFSAQALADAIGCTRNTICNYESGWSEPTSSRLFHISETLGVPFMEFFTYPPRPAIAIDCHTLPETFDE